MRGIIIKTSLLTISLSVAVVLVVGVIAPAKFFHSEAPTRPVLGLKGRMGYLVTQIDPSINQPEVSVGDIITASDATGQISNVEQFQSDVRNLTAGQKVVAYALRFDSSTSLFREIYPTLTIFASPSAGHGRLGLQGTPGFAISEIDSRVTQSELKIGDFITELTALGQLVDIEALHTLIKQLKVGSTIQARVLRYDASAKEFKELTITLGIFGFPSPSYHHSAKPEPSCPRGGGCGNASELCSWCCDCCPPDQACSHVDCETYKTYCHVTPAGFCTFTYCT